MIALLTAAAMLLMQAQTDAGVAPTVPSLANGSVLSAAQALKPGQFLWVPDVAPAGPLILIVNRRSQRAVLYRNGVPIGITTVSTGRSGHRTPIGVFSVLQKAREHYSSLYDAAPMPFMQRLTWDGVALHAGHLPGYAASHGCIRLPTRFAELIFATTALGMTVIVADRPLLPTIAALGDPFGGTGGPDSAIGATEETWKPEVSPHGPVSLIVSTSDRRLVVIRNGHIIGSAAVSVGTAAAGPRIYSLLSNDMSGLRWTQLVLPGQAPLAEGGTVRDHYQVSDEFRTRLNAMLLPGTTLIITPDVFPEKAAGYQDLLRVLKVSRHRRGPT